MTKRTRRPSTPKISRRSALGLIGGGALGVGFTPPASARTTQSPLLEEPPSLRDLVAQGALPPMALRLPEEPLVVDPEARGRALGVYGGVWRMLINKPKRVRYGNVYGYARLVGYDPRYRLRPDILRDVDVVGGRRFTFHLRRGHRWSDGHPLTSEDFRYWWEDVANNAELSPSGPPAYMAIDNAFPAVSYPDDLTVTYEWADPNPGFFALLAQAAPPFIYRPAHYLKQFHVKYTPIDTLRPKIDEARVRGWAPLHNLLDNMHKSDNPDLPSLQPWVNASGKEARRFHLRRNPYFHRIDKVGRQLPYIDEIEMSVASSGVIPAKTNAGEVDLQAHALSFKDVAILKQGEAEQNYQLRLWSNGAASQIALYPNLNYGDPVWRGVLRDARFRRALSVAIDRRIINRSLYFGLAAEVGMSALPQSPLSDPKMRGLWAQFDLAAANALLDEIGLTDRRADEVRLLPDGRPMEIVVETAGERDEVRDALELITETWREIGVKLLMRPLDRDVLRNRVASGASMMAVWFGWDNGAPTPEQSPEMLAPMHQAFFAWPKWGLHHASMGHAGEPVDMEIPNKLMDLAKRWRGARTRAARSEIWREMLAIHADQVYAIGVIAETPQPVVVSNRLRNVPENALWAWDPGGHFGVHRPDEFFFAES